MILTLSYDERVGGDNPFGDLFAKLGIKGAGKDPPAAAAAAPLKEVVIGYERRGGGGAVTTLREVPAARRTALLGELKRGLGCGGTLDETAGLIVLQGDHRARLTAWLEKQGTRVRGERG